MTSTVRALGIGAIVLSKASIFSTKINSDKLGHSFGSSNFPYDKYVAQKVDIK